MRTIVVLFALVACAFAQFGRGGQFPQSCKTAAENSKQCFTTNLQSKNVNIKIEDIKKCFESCPHTKGEGKGEGKGERRGKGKHSGSSSNEGTWAKAKEAFKAFGECIKQQMGDKMETCISGKITYDVVQPKTGAASKQSKGGPGGKHGHGGFHGGNPLKTLKDRVSKCPSSEVCVRAAMGDWYDKTDELSQILCDASTACPHTKSDTCKADLKAGRDARCACKEQLKTEQEQAKAACTTDENRAFLDRVSKRGGAKGKGEHNPCDDDSDEDDSGEHEKQNPFCSA